MFSILQRMIFIELFRVFFLCWTGLTGIVLLGGVIAEATQQGLGPGQILSVIPFLIPGTLPYTLPTTTLFATCVVYGRLAHDNEILAVKAAGINLVRVTLPAMYLGGAASLGTMALYYEVIPLAHWDLRTRFVKNIDDFLYGMLRKDGCIRHPGIPYTIFVKQVDGRKLIDATFMLRDPKNPQNDVVARGREAELEVDLDAKEIRVRMWHGVVRKPNNDESYFEKVEWPVPLPADIFDPKKLRPTDMAWMEMFDVLDDLHQKRDSVQQDIGAHEALLQMGPGARELVEHVRNQRYMIRMYDNLISNIHTELQMRPALSLGCLCFVLVGCPVGIWFSRSDYLSSFITCFLPIILVYYPLTLCGINIAKSGKLMPWLAIWPANLIIAASAMFLMRRLLRN